jgi:protein O-GlcNAc transferase
MSIGGRLLHRLEMAIMSEMNRWLIEEFERAVQHHNGGQLEQAVIAYQRILDIYPYLGQGNHNMGLIALDAGTLDDALRYFKLALDAEPGNHLFRKSLVLALIRAVRPY